MKKKKKTAVKKAAVKSKAKTKASAKTKVKVKAKATAKKVSRKVLAAPKRKKSTVPAKSQFIAPEQVSPAHSPGHRKMNIAENFTEKNGTKVHMQDSARDRMSRADQIRRTSKTNRRVITGAAIGKTGRIVTEKV